jgi:hypothetical protein
MDSDFPDQAKAGSDSLPSDAMAALLSSKSASRALAPLPLTRSLMRNGAATLRALGLAPDQSPSSSTRRLATKAEPWLAESLGDRWESYRERLDECREAPFSADLRCRRTRALRSFRKSADALFQFWPSTAAGTR